MKKMLVVLVAMMFYLVPMAFGLSIDDVGEVDVLTTYMWDSANSGDGAEASFFAEVLGVDASLIQITKFETEDGDGWINIADDDNTWAFDFGNLAPGYFLIKTGGETALASDPDITIYDSYMFENLANLQYAVVNLSLFVKTVGKMGIIDIDHFSHISISNSVPVPEPSTLLLFGAGIAGLAMYRRKRS